MLSLESYAGPTSQQVLRLAYNISITSSTVTCHQPLPGAPESKPRPQPIPVLPTPPAESILMMSLLLLTSWDSRTCVSLIADVVGGGGIQKRGILKVRLP